MVGQWSASGISVISSISRRTTRAHPRPVTVNFTRFRPATSGVKDHVASELSCLTPVVSEELLGTSRNSNRSLAPPAALHDLRGCQHKDTFTLLYDLSSVIGVGPVTSFVQVRWLHND